MEQKKKLSFRKWWRRLRPKKAVVFWSWVASVALTMIIGFVWGGWVTSAKAQTMAESTAKDAVTQRLAPICVAQFNQDPGRDQKLVAFGETGGSQRRTYVQDQGWATMPGEQKPDRQVADKCVELLMLVKQ
jgi:hypothetical protein